MSGQQVIGRVTTAVEVIQAEQPQHDMLLAIRRALLREVQRIEAETGLKARHCPDCPLRR